MYNTGVMYWCMGFGMMCCVNSVYRGVKAKKVLSYKEVDKTLSFHTLILSLEMVLVW